VVKKQETRFVKPREQAMRRHSKVPLLWIMIAWMLPFAATAQEFTLQIGAPIAGNAQGAKSSLLVVRPGGCADPAAAQITAMAEGLVDGERRSMPLTVFELPTPGVHAVPKGWAKHGVWVVSLVGTCAGKTAGAIVPVEPNATFRRDAVTLLARRPTPAEIDASLKLMTTGGPK
jgi:hypothetical protein